MPSKSRTPQRADVSWLAWLASVLVVAASVAFFSMQAVAQPTTQPTISGRARATDGDTLRIGDHRIRLWGIDAPESSVDCGDERPSREAREALRDIVGNRVVECVVRETDRHGREVSVCTIRGRDIATTLVERGWARDWPRYSCGAYAGSEAQARERRRGLWGMQCAAMWGDRNYSPDRCRQADGAN